MTEKRTVYKKGLYRVENRWLSAKNKEELENFSFTGHRCFNLTFGHEWIIFVRDSRALGLHEYDELSQI